MAIRVPIKTFVAELEAALNRKDGYIMGAYGQNPRTGYLDLNETAVKSSWRETGYYCYGQYSGSQRAQAQKWRKQCTRVWDCNGMAEGIYQLHTGVCIDSKARYNYAQWCSVKGSGMIPAKYRVPGAAVFWSNSGAGSIHHVAYLWKPVVAGKPEGDWYIIEARGVMYGVVSGKLQSRKPNFWGLMDKYYDYASSETGKVIEADPADTRTVLGSRILRNGCEGEDVKEMQSGLIRLGYDLGSWGADGEFGDCTELAVKAFQKDYGVALESLIRPSTVSGTAGNLETQRVSNLGLEVDGEFGPLSLAEYEKALVKLDAKIEDPKRVIIEGGNCYVRTGPGTQYSAFGVAMRGTALPFGGMIDEETKWLLVEYKNRNGWVSPKYGRVI